MHVCVSTYCFFAANRYAPEQFRREALISCQHDSRIFFQLHCEFYCGVRIYIFIHKIDHTLLYICHFKSFIKRTVLVGRIHSFSIRIGYIFIVRPIVYINYKCVHIYHLNSTTEKRYLRMRSSV